MNPCTRCIGLLNLDENLRIIGDLRINDNFDFQIMLNDNMELIIMDSGVKIGEFAPQIEIEVYPYLLGTIKVVTTVPVALFPDISRIEFGLSYYFLDWREPHIDRKVFQV